MSLSIQEQITQNVVTTLSGISTLSGYNNTLIVEEQEQPANQPRDRLAIVLLGDNEEVYPAPLGFEQYTLPLGVAFYAIQSESSDTAIASALRSIAADIRKAMMQDVQRGALAINTEFETDKFYETSSPKSGLVTAKITYRHLRGNPYQQ